ncbi:hypothetical protein [Chthoniobacter flavus]|uniref:hypothetical protein n=1 Tax=Chthoniobacter flavus TaxID=191863 RepID=UPI0002DB9BB7|nr:hypothetical protein [Chthoniobacter flavus]
MLKAAAALVLSVSKNRLGFPIIPSLGIAFGFAPVVAAVAQDTILHRFSGLWPI